MTPADMLKTLFPTPMEQTVEQRFPWLAPADEPHAAA